MKNSKNLQFRKLEKLSILKIPKIVNLKNSKNLQPGKLEQFAIFKISEISKQEYYKNLKFGKFQKFTIRKISKILKICNLENSNNLQLEKSQKFPTWKIRKNLSSAECGMDEQFQNCKFFSQILVLQIDKIYKFVNFLIWTIIKISNKKSSKYLFSTRKVPKIFNLKNHRYCQFGKF